MTLCRSLFRAFLATLALSVVVVLVRYSSNSGRFHVIEAQTRGFRVTVHGDTVKWRLDAVVLCNKLEKIDYSAKRNSDELCLPFVEIEKNLDSAEFAVPHGTVLQVTSFRDFGVVIERLNTGPAISIGSKEETLHLSSGERLIVPTSTWNQVGGLAFSGQIQIGEELASSESGYLLSGRYEIRQPLWFGGSEPVAVKSSTFVRGDVVTLQPVRSAISGVTARGFLSPVEDKDKSGFHTVAVSAPDNARLMMKSFGVEATEIGPSWTDKALNDPTALALASILGLLGFVIAVLTLLLEVIGGEEDDDEQST